MCKIWCLKFTKKKLRPIWADNLTHISGRSRYRKQTARVPLPKGTPHHEAEVNCFATKAQSKNGCQYMKHLIRGIHIIPYTTMYIHIYIYMDIYISRCLFRDPYVEWLGSCFQFESTEDMAKWQKQIPHESTLKWQSGKQKHMKSPKQGPRCFLSSQSGV